MLSINSARPLDWATLEFTEVGFGDTMIAVPAGSQYFRTTVDMNYNAKDFEVDIQLAFQSETGKNPSHLPIDRPEHESAARRLDGLPAAGGRHRPRHGGTSAM